MHAAGAAIALALAALLCLPAAAQALEQKLTASDGAAEDDLGQSVAIDGDTAVVGARGADNDRGAVYVFRRAGDSWTQTAKLTASDGAAGDGLGDSVAIQGATIVAGASNDEVGGKQGQGSVYTFARTGPATRSETAKLTASDGATFDGLGDSVAIDGDTIVAGASGDDVGGNSEQGSVYTFAGTGAAVRTETAKLTALDGAADDHLGDSVAIDAAAIVAGASDADVDGKQNQGSAYTFARTGPALRNETAKLTASDGEALDRLGLSVAIDGETIVAGAFRAAVGGNWEQGAAYTFAVTGGDRTETAKLAASDGEAFDRLGNSVAIEGETIVAGAPGDDVGGNSEQGSVYTFAGTGAAVRTETAKLTAADGAASDQLGLRVAIDRATILAGAPFDKVGANTDQGSATIFFPPAPRPPGGGGGGGGSGTPPGPGTVPCPEDTSPTVICTRDAEGRLRYQGTDASETFAGTEGEDVMVGEGGRDQMNARAGNDEMKGGADKDKLKGGGGRDKLKGGGGKDSLKGNGGRDRLSGQGGKDRLKGGGGKDRLRGGKGKDNLSGQGGKDRLKGNGGRDRFSGGGGNDKINSKGQRREKVGCGAGKRDRVKNAKGDRVKRSCERVRR